MHQRCLQSECWLGPAKAGKGNWRPIELFLQSIACSVAESVRLRHGVSTVQNSSHANIHSLKEHTEAKPLVKVIGWKVGGRTVYIMLVLQMLAWCFAGKLQAYFVHMTLALSEVLAKCVTTMPITCASMLPSASRGRVLLVQLMLVEHFGCC